MDNCLVKLKVYTNSPVSSVRTRRESSPLILQQPRDSHSPNNINMTIIVCTF